MADTFRAMCAELHTAIQLYTGQNPAAANVPPAELVCRLMDAMAASAALLAQPVAEGPTDEEWGALVVRAWDQYETVGYQGERFMYDSDFGNALDFVRRELARWGHPTPQPPADGGVEYALEEVRCVVHELCDAEKWIAAERLERAAELLQRFVSPACHVISPSPEALASLKADGPGPGIIEAWPAKHTVLVPVAQPVAVSERLPEPSVKVLAHYFTALGKGRTICAIWVPAKSRSDEGDLDGDDFLEYDEENDKHHWPEGWYEAIENWDDIGWARVYEGEVAYWQPLPKWPANALPLPLLEDTND